MITGALHSDAIRAQRKLEIAPDLDLFSLTPILPNRLSPNQCSLVHTREIWSSHDLRTQSRPCYDLELDFRSL